jgi:hypothetical protein
MPFVTIAVKSTAARRRTEDNRTSFPDVVGLNNSNQVTPSRFSDDSSGIAQVHVFLSV